MNKRHIGGIKEQLAAKYLQDKGLHILETNYRNRFGEIDIIAKDNDTIVFIEVKYRKTASTGHPEEAVNYKKIKTICKVSDYYRITKKLSLNTPIRYDVIAIEGDKLRWHINAFSYTI